MCVRVFPRATQVAGSCETPETMSTPSIKFWFLNIIFTKGNQSSLKKWRISRLGHTKYKSLEYITESESKEVPKSDRGMEKTTPSFNGPHNGKTWDNSSIKITVVMDHIPLNKKGI